ncbi:MAG: N4-gp56 family major capsid protein [Chloroflexi bacterium]|nr:MAG: N4-gp56 family major capsid protein [Chloroflexota bacterium]
MADIFTGATSAASTGQLSNQVLTAYQRSAFFALRAGTVFDQFAKVKPGNLTSPGNPVSFLFWDDMTLATTALTETVDVDAVALGDSQVTVTPAEYGDAVLLTIRIRTDDFLIGFDSDVANLLNYGMVNTIDRLARTAADGGGTEVIHTDATAETDLGTGDGLDVVLVRKQRAALAKASVMTWDGSSYGAVIHPDVAYDFKAVTGDGSWSDTAQRSEEGARIWNDEIGKFANIRFVESPRAKISDGGGSGTVDSYTTYFFGQEFLAKAESIPPHMVLGPVTDKLMRFQPLGWHLYAGWDTLREAALRRVLTASSIGDN